MKMEPPSKRAMIGLPETGDRPGRGGVAWVLAGMVSGNGRVLGARRILWQFNRLHHARQHS